MSTVSTSAIVSGGAMIMRGGCHKEPATFEEVTMASGFVIGFLVVVMVVSRLFTRG